MMMLRSYHGVELPSDILLTNILPLLDRRSFDRLSSTCKAFHESLSFTNNISINNNDKNTILPPWPDRLVAKNHLCRMKSFAFSSSGMSVACGCSDGRVRLWHLKQGEQTPLEGHWPEEAVHSVVFGGRQQQQQSDNHHLLASASTDHTILIWNLVVVTPTTSTAMSSAAAAASSSSSLLSKTSARARAMIEVQGEPRKFHSSNVSCLRFSPDDTMIIAAHHSSETIKFWNLATGSLVQTLLGPLSRVSTMEIAKDGRTLAAAVSDDDNHNSNCVRVWNLEDSTYETKRGGFHNVLSESNNGGFVAASVYQPESFNIWSATSECKRRRTNNIQSRRFLNAYPHEIAFSEDGSKVASVDDFQSIKIWRVQDGKLLSTFHDESAVSLHAISICPNSRTLGAISRTRIGAISRKQNLVRLFQLHHDHSDDDNT